MKVQELKERIEKGQDIILLDIREEDEVAESGQSIAAAENVPMGKVFVKSAKDELPKDKKIITICKTGGRCEIVTRELKQKGYDIEYLEGGMEEWKED